MSPVFISYSRRDVQFVQQLARNLEEAGFDVWWDVSDLRGGEAWVRAIQAALKRSQYCVVVLSPDAVTSDWVEKEYTYALRLGLRIIPLLYKTCEVPMALANIHYVDFRESNFEGGLRELLRAIAGTGGHPPESAATGRGVVQMPLRDRFLDALRDDMWQMIGVVVSIIALVWAVYTFYAGEEVPATPTPGPESPSPATTAVMVSAATQTPTVGPKTLTDTPSPEPTQTPTNKPLTPTTVVASRPSHTPTATATVTATVTRTVTPSRTPTATPTATPTVTPVYIFGVGIEPGVYACILPGEQYEICRRNPDGTVTNLTNNPDKFDGYPTVSPDGTKIYFETYRGDRDKGFEIYVMNADGSELANLTDSQWYDGEPNLSPDGTRIAYRCIWEICVMNTDGSGKIHLTDRPKSASSGYPQEDQFPRWSPDGTRIAFQSNRDGNFEIYVINTDGSGEMRLTNNPLNDLSPSWLSNNTIKFIRSEDGEYVINADGSGESRQP